MVTKKCTTLLIAYSSGKNSHHYHKQKMTMCLLNSFQSILRIRLIPSCYSYNRQKQEQVNPEYIESQHEIEHRMQSFMPVSSNDITSVISSSPAKHCALDPLPTFMLKQNIGPFSEIIAKIVNTSLQQGVVSKNLKEALLKPLIKSMSLEVIFKSFRPILNLSFLSKTIERIVCRQLSNYMNRTGKLEDLQSAYRSNHLMETALLKVKTDILNAMQNKQVTCLILLDLSAAFDTISHSKLINRLKFRFGLDGVVLHWITDYLANRTQRVVIKQDKFSNLATSSPVTLDQGIPQGSVLGPNLFSWFISPLGDLCKKYGIDYHGYADDRQLYLSFKPKVPMDQVTCIRRLELCIAEIRCWMKTNFLKLNDSKTEFILLGTQYQLQDGK